MSERVQNKGQLCGVGGCGEPAHCRGYCMRHYGAWRRYGDPAAIGLEWRFWSKVDKRPGGCWLWTASKLRKGYGCFTVHKRTMPAHRFAYELLVGPIPEGLHLDHLCRVTSCVNPAHLEPVTSRENVVVRGRGITARNARKTHCPQGHPYDEHNTYVKPTGARVCRTCQYENKRRRRAAA